ncbi:winged helix-turn-helix transcriptional regulator [Pseudomonas sp. FP2300]|uniref:winged helix-turn-helix transcriptional regulator n=1 Tax=Pseudomonas sp. FP2300 TaxID=2954090 RepID=UPI002734A0EE|nr:winged helix-turn-helix transcriptional regulator [Pseudomonas sp. FP2300]WLH65273.1 winged helix-turn-helix transcriptional regulator [Pseudomonas sp. FP2300]
MTNKTYGQLCPIARSLDVLGDRWTLLLIREFLLGPKRFKDLLAILPAMGTNRLSERLAMLVQNGVIQQVTLRTPPATPAYELTALGEQLRKPVLALGFWGLGLPIDERIDPASARAELIALCLTGANDSAASAGLQELYEFQVEAEVFHVQVNDGHLLARSGPSAEPADVKIQCDMETFIALVLRQITPTRALREGHVTLLQGDRPAFTRVFKVLEYKP